MFPFRFSQQQLQNETRYTRKPSSFPDFELFWPRGNRVARIIEGGEIAGINGYMHMIESVLIYEPDLRAEGCLADGMAWQTLLVILSMWLQPGLPRH